MSKQLVGGLAAVGSIVAALSFTSPSGAQAPGDASVESVPAPLPIHVGERLTPDLLGPGVVETMDVAIAREEARLAVAAERETPDEITHGSWYVPPARATRFPHSGRRNVVNKYGDTSMGIAFPGVVDVRGAYFARQMTPEVTTTGVTVIGYRGGVEVARTRVFRDIGEKPGWFAMDLSGVDRIVIEAEAVVNGAGWYAMDDLTYIERVEREPPPTGEPRTVVIDFEDAKFRQELTGTGYRGLVWEQGTGDFLRDDAVHAPVRSPDEMDEGGGEGGVDDDGGDVDGGGALLGGGGTTPNLVGTFQGVLRGDDGSFSFPPDSNGAVGPDHFVITVNRNFAVYDKETGDLLISMLLGSFLPGSNGDPRVLYDHFANRWVVLVSDFTATTSNYLAVSLTDDATGAWFKTSFVTATGSDSGCWPDYPTLGIDANGYYSAANMVGCAFSLFVIDKAPLIADPPSLGTITAFRGLASEGAIQPVLTYGDPGGEYVVSRQSSSSIRVRKVVGPMAAPTLQELGSVSIPSHSGPPDAPALGSGTPLDHSVSHRLLNAVYRLGSIWTVHDVSVDGRSAVRWYEVDETSLNTLQVGTVSDSSLHYLYGGIAVNAERDVVLGFTGTNSSQYAGCYYTGRDSSDPPGEMGPPVQYKEGTGPQNNIDNVGRNRWGDYSLSTVDPDDDLTFFTIQEYGHDTDIWGTYVAELQGEVRLLAFEYPDGIPARIDPAGDTLRVSIAGINGGALDPATPALHYDDGGGGGFVVSPMVEVSAGLYDAVFPAIDCGAEVSFFVRARSTTGVDFNDPPAAPGATFATLSAVDVIIALNDDFETDLGWTAENLGASSGDWQRGVPVDDPGWDYDPAADGDGSGQAFLTQNEVGNTDVDGGAVRLTSPALDLSAEGVTLAYEYYLRLTDEDGNDRLLVEASDDGLAGPWQTIATHTTDGGLAWRHVEITQVELEAAGLTLNDDMRIRLTANDADAQSIVEAGVDGLTITALVCDTGVVGDIDGDGDVDFQDLLLMLGSWGPCPAPPAECPADLDGDMEVGFNDLLSLLAGWTP